MLSTQKKKNHDASRDSKTASPSSALESINDPPTPLHNRATICEKRCRILIRDAFAANTVARTGRGVHWVREDKRFYGLSWSRHASVGVCGRLITSSQTCPTDFITDAQRACRRKCSRGGEEGKKEREANQLQHTTQNVVRPETGWARKQNKTVFIFYFDSRSTLYIFFFCCQIHTCDGFVLTMKLTLGCHAPFWLLLIIWGVISMSATRWQHILYLDWKGRIRERSRTKTKCFLCSLIFFAEDNWMSNPLQSRFLGLQKAIAVGS